MRASIGSGRQGSFDYCTNCPDALSCGLMGCEDPEGRKESRMGHLSEGVPSGEGPMWSEDPLPDQLEYELNRALTDPDEDDDFRARRLRDRTGRSAVCDLHEVSGCVICHPRPAPTQKPPAATASTGPRFRRAADPPIIPAAFDSDCPSCEGPIYEGDMITVIYGEWVHVGCE